MMEEQTLAVIHQYFKSRCQGAGFLWSPPAMQLCEIDGQVIASVQRLCKYVKSWFCLPRWAYITSLSYTLVTHGLYLGNGRQKERNCMPVISKGVQGSKKSMVATIP